MSEYVYIRSEPGLYTVGFHDPGGKWHPESDHNSTDAAAARAALLNGNSPDLLPPLTASIAIVADRDRYKRERDELREALSEANRQMDLAADCVEKGLYDEALLHLRIYAHRRMDALSKLSRGTM